MSSVSRLPYQRPLGIGQNTGNSYPIVETFYSLQGEGFWTGTPAYFVRLAGCDVGCSWCDTKESWPINRQRLDSKAIASDAFRQNPAICVVTGGEPLMHDLGALTEGLRQRGLKTHLETSGTHPLSGQWDWITLSPKFHRLPLPDIWKCCDEVKVIIQTEEDLYLLNSLLPQETSATSFFLQPEWGNFHQIMPSLVKYIQTNPKWRLSLQTHKFMGIR